MPTDPESDPRAEASTADSLSSPSGPGRQIGPYRLLEVLGEGGMGTVYLAEQTEPVRREVALKVVKLGMDTKQVIARFEAERQALALMDHPNVAQVYDGGATEEGRPYFVMEHVSGVPITKHCDRDRLTIDERLDLFMQVCDAVQHAHQKGIIHRDIKPSNVLVAIDGTKALPKVIDFGVAKAISQKLTEKTLFTEQGQLVGTPEYMSPEQAEMTAQDIDTRSDIYSLGVVLYELLTGSLPFDPATLRAAGFAEIQRIIREQEPPKPSTKLSSLGDESTTQAKNRQIDPGTHMRALRGDLDWIVMKCLEKDRRRRYETANGLAQDIRRHLADEPVLASPPGAGYRIGKLVKRNRLAVTAAVLIFFVLVAGITGTTWGLVSAKRQAKLASDARDAESAAKAQAQQRAEELEKVAEFQSGQLSGINVSMMGINLRLDVIEKRRSALGDRGLDEQAIQAKLDELDRSLSGVNFTDVALKALDQNIFTSALKAIDEQFADQPVVKSRLLQTVAVTLHDVGLLEAATAPQEQALAIRRRALGDEHPDTLTSISNLGFLLQDQGKLAEAEQYYREALAGFRRMLGDEHPDTLTSIGNLGFLLLTQGKLAEAEPYYREALEGSRRVLGDEHPDTLGSINNMGFLLQTRGKLAEAEQYYREALEARRLALGDEHTDTLFSINNMGGLLQARGKLAEAEPYYREALAGFRRMLGDEHPYTLGSINNMGFLLLAQGKLADAEPYYREALEARRHVLGDEHPDTLGSINNMGFLLHAQGKLAEAEPYFREAPEARRRALGDEHPDTLTSINNLGFLLLAQGKLAEAEPYYREALEARRHVLGDEHSDTLGSIRNMGALFNAQGRYDEAEALLRESLDTGEAVLGENDWRVAEARSLLGEAISGQSRFDEAELLLLEGHTGLEAALPAGRRAKKLPPAIERLVRLYEARHEAEPDEGYDAKAADWRALLAEAEENGTGAGEPD